MGAGERLVAGSGDGVDRLLDLQAVEQLLEALAVFGQVDRIWGRAEDRNSSIGQGLGQFERCLAAELNDDAQQGSLRLLHMDQLEHIFGGQWLEIEPVGGVVIRRDRLGVAIDHDRFNADLVEREGGVAATIVKFDALSDSIWTAAQDDRLARVGWLALAVWLLTKGAAFVGR